MYFYTAKVQYERSVLGTVGIYMISTRKKKSEHFVRSVLFGMDLTKCTDFSKSTDTCRWYILQDWYILVPIF